MKICRVMSLEEFHLLTSYTIIEGIPQGKTRTSCQLPRVCFFPTEQMDHKATLVLHNWSNGEIIVHFEVDENLLTEDFGCYPDWTSNSWDDVICLTEYYVSEYSRESFKPLYWEWKNDRSGKTYPIH